MRNQLDLPYNGQTAEQRWWRLVLSEVRRVVDSIGLKEAAFACDVKPSYLAHALSERDRHYLRLEWLLPLLAKTEDLGLARALLDPVGLDVSRQLQLSPEEKLARLEQALAETLGPDIRKSIFDKAWRQG